MSTTSRRAAGRSRLILASTFVVLVVSVLGLPAPAGAAASADAAPTASAVTTHVPVIFVHGYASTTSVWTTMIGRFQASGYQSGELFNFDYNWHQSNITTARDFDIYVAGVLAQTGATKVDVVTHSMGGLSTRWCAKFRSCRTKIAHWVSIGGPNHGTTWASTCPNTPACVDMTPGSPFLTQLNANDETPGTIAYLTIRSGCDYMIQPGSSVILTGATNLVSATCVRHVYMLEDLGITNQTLTFLTT